MSPAFAQVQAPAASPRPTDADFLAALGELREASFADKEAIVDRLSASGHPSVRPVLAALLEDRLFYRTQDQKVFIVKSADDSLTSFALVDPVSLADAGPATPSDLNKIGTNNRLRRVLKTAVARFDLSSADPAVRLAAVSEVMRSLDEPSIALLRERVRVEPNAGVKDEIETGLAQVELDSGDPKARLDAIATLAHRLRPEVRNRLAGMLEQVRRRHASSRRDAGGQAGRRRCRALDRSRRARSTRASRRSSSA